MIYLLSPDPPPRPGVIHLPAIEIQFYSRPIEWEGVEYLLFTSKNGVRGVARLGERWKEFPAVVVGEGTRREVERLGGKVALIGDGYGESLVERLGHLPPATFLFCRGEQLSTDLKPLLEGVGHRVREVILYRSRCNPALPPVVEGVPIFTSPSTVRCLFRRSRVEGEVAVAIGRKTARELERWWGGEILIPETPTIPRAIEVAEEWLRGRGEQ